MDSIVRNRKLPWLDREERTSDKRDTTARSSTTKVQKDFAEDQEDGEVQLQTTSESLNSAVKTTAASSDVKANPVASWDVG